MLNTGHYLTFTTIMNLVICGMAQYLTGINGFFWLPCILAFLMLGFHTMQVRYRTRPLDTQEWIVLLLLVGGVVLAIATTVLQSGITTTLIGYKNTFCLAILTYCMITGFVNENQLFRSSQIFYAIYYAQVPALAHQIFIVLPKRVAIMGDFEKWDSVVGTFGGEQLGGGNGAALGMFALLVALLKLSDYKHGVCSKGSLYAHVISAFVVCILAEVKFVILISPFILAFTWLSKSYLKGMKSYSFKTMLLIAGSSLLLVVLAVYILGLIYMNTSDFYTDPTKSPFVIFWGSIDYIFDPNYIMDGGQLGRMTTIFFWLENSDLHGIAGELFGYGLNSTNDGGETIGYLASWFNLELDSTSTGVLLWETGSVGITLYILAILYVFRITKPFPALDRSKLSKEELQFIAMQPAFRAFLLTCLLSIPYSPILVRVSGLQYLFYFCMGGGLVIRRTILTHLGK
ncbi:capsular biosynthesis protein [Vibrio sp. HN007]|uniref:capsular biosynthesis protein n=1 Tax=Vibrio iocasae TaxID=3098914 RepID=UPI0035D403F6